MTRRALADIVRRAALSSYGVASVSGPRSLDRLSALLGLTVDGVLVETDPTLEVDVFLSVAYGLPVAEVARNVESQIRYAISHDVGRELADVRVHVDRLQVSGSGHADGREVGA